MGNGKDRKGRFYVYAVLWGVPGLLTLYETYRLLKLQTLKNADFYAGPVGYMCGVGLLLMGFCIWEIIAGLKNRTQETRSDVRTSHTIVKKVYFCIAYMVLFLVLTPVLGFILASGIFLGACMRLLRCSLIEIVITVIVYCGSFYWFLPYLGISLPQGIWGI
jgi:hypothetical protein